MIQQDIEEMVAAYNDDLMEGEQPMTIAEMTAILAECCGDTHTEPLNLRNEQREPTPPREYGRNEQLRRMVE